MISHLRKTLLLSVALEAVKAQEGGFMQSAHGLLKTASLSPPVHLKGLWLAVPIFGLSASVLHRRKTISAEPLRPRGRLAFKVAPKYLKQIDSVHREASAERTARVHSTLLQ